MYRALSAIGACLITAVFLAAPQSLRAADSINWTFYAPGASGWMQGPMKAAYPDAGGSSNAIHTLDDVRTGTSKYVTLASASTMKGRWYCIGTVTYTSPRGNGGDGQTHTLENVIGYVHDTGCAFNGTCSCEKLPQYCSKQSRTDKMDIAVGNYSGYGATEAMNHVTKNPNRAPASWQQIAGLPAAGSKNGPCGGEAKETGSPTRAAYDPAPTGASAAPVSGVQTSPAAIGTAAGTAATGVSSLATPQITSGNMTLSTTVSSGFTSAATNTATVFSYGSTTATSTSILNLLNALAGSSTVQSSGTVVGTPTTSVTLDPATTESLWALSAQTDAEADAARTTSASATQVSPLTTFSSTDMAQPSVAPTTGSESALWDRVRSMLDQARSMLLDILGRLRAVE